MQLKTLQGLSTNPLGLRNQVNNEARAVGKKVRLRNLYETLNVGRPSMYRRFKVSSWKGPKARPWQWETFWAPSRELGHSIEVPFSGQQRIKIVKSIVDRQVDLNQLQAEGLIGALFPLDTR